MTRIHPPALLRATLLCAAASFVLLPASAQDAPKLLAPGAVAPDFVCRDLAGNDVRLSDHRGKVVVIDFWATWCAPCIASFPHVHDVAKQW